MWVHKNLCIDDNYKKQYKSIPNLYDDIIKYGLDDFIVEKLFESDDIIEVSRMESKYIRGNKENELMYNSSLGASGRRVLSDEDVFFIRELYNEKSLYIFDAYDLYYKDIVTFRAFKKAWHGDTFKDIHYDVYIEENKNWHFSKGQSRPGEINRSAVFTEKEVLDIRRRRDNGESQKSVRELYKHKKITSSGFSSIWNGITWKYLV